MLIKSPYQYFAFQKYSTRKSSRPFHPCYTLDLLGHLPLLQTVASTVLMTSRTTEAYDFFDLEFTEPWSACDDFEMALIEPSGGEVNCSNGYLELL